MNRIYLCGPINGCTDEECKDWREYVKSKWDGGTIDPMRRDYRGKEDESVNEIVELDKIDVIDGNILLVNKDKPSDGTAMETLYGWERAKLVVTVAPKGARISPWTRYHSHLVLHSFDEAMWNIKKLRS
jgi:hypothetical protein